MSNHPLPRGNPWAIVSVYDKTGIVNLAEALAEHGIGIMSTGGTAKHLREQTNLQIYDVGDYTQFPEMMDGRVKTLHPKVHGGILHRRDLPEHIAVARANGMVDIDFVIVNLYPFVQTISKQGVSFEEAIEQIDIGGPGMLRSAGKNHGSVTAVVNPDDYVELIKELRRCEGVTSPQFRRRMATKVFACTSQYDSEISAYLGRNGGDDDGSPRLIH